MKNPNLMTTKNDKHDCVCCICGCRIDGYPNEAWSMEKGKCCPACNWSVVQPARIRLSKPPMDDGKTTQKSGSGKSGIK